MKILATYCSAEKDERLDLLPAFQRYQSKRINLVMGKAQELGIPFMIISGQFGLIRFDHPLPYYDHLLRPDKVGDHAKFVAGHITKIKITEIEFYSRKIEHDPNLQAYHDCMRMACEIAQIELQIIHDTFQE